jgi:effector-binding domain-containing protein
LISDRGPQVAYEIVLGDVAARPLAAVRSSVPVGQVAGAWRPALDKVWAFLRRHDGLRTDGHNIFVYRHPARPGEPMQVEFGVEVSRAFEGEDGVVFSHSPAGHVASTLHVGPIDQLGMANAAIEAWCRANHRELAGVSWEIYGDPGDDPAISEVQVFYLKSRSSIC